MGVAFLNSTAVELLWCLLVEAFPPFGTKTSRLTGLKVMGKGRKNFTSGSLKIIMSK